ncbi:MAG: ADP-ribosylglycohydrolase family protein [Anaerolineae bacterium]|nr:ADP-ribosylglycohydrolase family protein [Anaerolineae bacterium]MDW8172770.1 ADP-ribosylglycohydrolase family protein [Anaerolineae bacterium]
MTSRQDKILGGLYGQALGDAWGMPAYFDFDDTRRAFGWIEGFLPAPDDHEVHKGLPAARITDDSEQAFSLATEYVKEGGVTLEATVRAIVGWYDRTGGDESPYVGPSTRRGIQALKRGVDPREAGRMGDTNGAAMRVSPVGLLHPNDPLAAVEAAYISCIPTHHTNVAISGASAVAAAISVALHDSATLDSVIAAGILGAELGRQKGFKWIGASIARRIELAVNIAHKPVEPLARLRELYDVVGTSLATSETVPAAFGVLAMAQGDPVQTACYAANLSGDADTVGAIACAIAGAFKGFAAIPATYVDQLDSDPIMISYHVRDLARSMAQLGDLSK